MKKLQTDKLNSGTPPEGIDNIMISDAELCRDILYLYADEPHYPSKIQWQELCQAFPDRTTEELKLNVQALQEAGLLNAKINYIADNRIIQIGFIVGLFPYKGSEFVHNARSSKIWNAAMNKIKQEGVSFSLNRLYELLTTIWTS